MTKRRPKSPEPIAESEFENCCIVQDRLFESDFDRLLKQSEYGDTHNTNKG